MISAHTISRKTTRPFIRKNFLEEVPLRLEVQCKTGM